MSDNALDRMLPAMLADDVMNPDRLPHGHHVQGRSTSPDRLTAPAHGSSGRPDHLHATRPTLPVSQPDRSPTATPQTVAAAPAERASRIGSITPPHATTAAPPVTQAPSRTGPSGGGQMAVPRTQAPADLHDLLTLLLTAERGRTMMPMQARPAPAPILSSIKVTR